MDTKTIVGICAGILTALASLPQIFKILKTKKVKAVSPVTYFVLLAGNGLWVWYGVLLNDWPITITNSFSFLAAVTVIILKYKYQQKDD